MIENSKCSRKLFVLEMASQNMSFAYFGYDRFDAFLNMSIDEVLLNETGRTGRGFLRFYDFVNPSLILAYNQSESEVDAEKSRFDITRRLSQGGVILCDENTLCYSVVVPRHPLNLRSTHDVFGYKMAKILENYTDDIVSIGEHYSVRINGKPVVGNGQRQVQNAILYHGTIAVYPWDHDKIIHAIHMEKAEQDFVRSLPSISDYSHVDKEKLALEILDSFADRTHNVVAPAERDRIIVEAKKLEHQKYRNPLWIKFGPHHDKPEEERINDSKKLHTGWGFCFADVKFQEPKKQINI